MISKLQFQHIYRNAVQRIIPNQVAVIGGYHGANLGDMALGKAVTEALRAKGIRSGLQTIYNLDKWPFTKLGIVGGGAVGYPDSLMKVAKRYNGHFDNLALLGVDFNASTYPEECLNLIRKSAYVSSRSKSQADRLITLTGRNDISYHPDIAFSLMRDFCMQQRRQTVVKNKKKVLLNVVPLYGKFLNGKLIPAENYREERPELYENFETMQRSYKSVIRELVMKAQDEGYDVESLPFTPGDEAFGKYLLDGLPVKHLTYDADPLKMIRYMSTASQVIATRFHTSIFAIKLGVPLIPIAYAKKNELMLQDMGVKQGEFLTTTDLAVGKITLPGYLTIQNEKIEFAETQSLDAINYCISKLYESNY